MASNDTWNIDSSDRDFLTRQGATEREAILAAGFIDGVPPWRIGEVAGYGAGRSSDPEKQRQNWSAAVSRAAKRGGQVVPRIRALIDALKHFREHGVAPSVAGEREVLEKLSAVIRGSSDTQIISAGKALLEAYRRDGVQKTPSAEEVVKTFVVRVGADATRKGFELLGAGNLTVLVPKVDVVEAETEALASLTGAEDDLNSRLDALEQRL